MPPEYEPGEDTYPVVWALVFTGPHRDHGGWWQDRGVPVCACGATLTAPERQAA
jgi:hypothetical protein